MFREVTNDDRAGLAQAAIDTFMRETGTDSEDAISDLLCNLMHLCNQRGDDFTAELNRGAGHYQAEVEIEAKQDAGEECDPSGIADDPHHYVKVPGFLERPINADLVPANDPVRKAAPAMLAALVDLVCNGFTDEELARRWSWSVEAIKAARAAVALAQGKI